MAKYTYKIITKDNTIKEGSIEAPFGLMAKRQLEKDGSTVMHIDKTGHRLLASLPAITITSMSPIEKIMFFRNFAMMLDSGISISESLSTLTNQLRGYGAKQAVARMGRDIENGGSLSSAMKKHPNIFPMYIAKTIEVGEHSGTLSRTLDRISLDLEKNYELRRKVISAIAYPLVIVVLMCMTALLLVIFVLPQLIALFADLGAPLPPMTRALNMIGVFAVSYPLQILSTIIAFIIASSLLMRSPTVRYGVHNVWLHLPIFGTLIKEYNLVRFTRVLTTLLSSGITFIHALEASKGTLGNEVYIQSIEKLYPVILNGGNLSDAVRTKPFLFPDQLRQIIEVGERSGKLRQAFERASMHYERSVTFQTQILTTLVEPILMLIAGVLIGGLAFSIFAPIYKVADYI